MSAELPSPWAQAFPRSVRLAPEALLVPSATLRMLLRRGTPIDLVCSGFALAPWIVDGQVIRVNPRADPRHGDLVLCEAAGWGDLRRVLDRPAGGTVLTGLDACPEGRDAVERDSVLGVVQGTAGAGGLLGRLIAALFPLWSPVAALIYWGRRILGTPRFGDGAADSVKEKYAQQVDGYSAVLACAIEEGVLDLLRRRVPAGGAVLVAGSGAGAEILHLVREGYRVTGFDFVPQMVEASRRNAAAAGLPVEVLLADMAGLDLGTRRFDAVYITPDVYSFVAGRGRRIEALRRLGRHLAPRGFLVLSARLIASPARFAEALLAWARHRRSDPGYEFGDWSTWFLTPRGTIGTSFVHLSFTRQVMAEARAAGFARVERAGKGHFLAADFRG